MKEIFAFRKKFIAAGRRQGWWSASGVVAALSGGGDSVALLWLLHNFYPGRVVAAHLDHCTRNGASAEDAAFAVSLCESWGVECRVKRVEVWKERQQGESFEMAGRRERYLHFRETASACGLKYIAVGHSADDLVETQLMNLFRGTGLAGLRGIPEARGDVVRPIIDFRRSELRRLLVMNNVAWREDESNTDTQYARNRVRRELIPWIKDNLNPNFEVTMAGLAKQLDAELSERERRIKRLLGEVECELAPALVCWRAGPLLDVTDAELAEMLRAEGAALELPTLSRERTLLLASLFRKGGCWRFQWAGDVEICYSNRGIGWLRRRDIKSGVKNTGKTGLPWWAV